MGFVIGTFSVVALCSRIFVGRLADRKGRKRAFLTGLSSCTFAGIAYLLPWGIGGIYLGRVLQGFGEACLYTGAAAWAVEVAGIHRSARALGYLSSGIWGGIAAGPLIGQLLGSFNNAARFQVVAALSAAALLTQVPEDYQPSQHTRRRGWLRAYIVPGGDRSRIRQRPLPGDHRFSDPVPGAPRQFRTGGVFHLRRVSSCYRGSSWADCRIAFIPASRTTADWRRWHWAWESLPPDLPGPGP